MRLPFVLLAETQKMETKMSLPITSLVAAVLAVGFLILTYRVIVARSAAGASILHADDMTLALKIRVHGNFAEFVPFALILLALAEMAGSNQMALYGAGGLLVASRILIPFGMDIDRIAHPLRIIGNMGTHGAILICVVLIAISQFS